MQVDASNLFDTLKVKDGRGGVRANFQDDSDDEVPEPTPNRCVRMRPCATRERIVTIWSESPPRAGAGWVFRGHPQSRWCPEEPGRPSLLLSHSQ